MWNDDQTTFKVWWSAKENISTGLIARVAMSGTPCAECSARTKQLQQTSDFQIKKIAASFWKIAHDVERLYIPLCAVPIRYTERDGVILRPGGEWVEQQDMSKYAIWNWGHETLEKSECSSGLLTDLFPPSPPSLPPSPTSYSLSRQKRWPYQITRNSCGH